MRQRPSMLTDATIEAKVSSMYTYLGLLEAAFISLPPNEELLELLNIMTDHRDDALRLHRLYMDTKYQDENWGQSL